MDTLSQLTMNWRSSMLGLMMVCTLIVLGYLYSRALERRATVWLMAFVGAGIVTSIPLVIGFAGFFDRWPGLTFLPTQMTLLFGPLILLHARTLMIDRSLGRWLWLLLPGLIYWVYQVIAFIFLRDYETSFLQDHVTKWAFNEAIHYPYVVPFVFYLGLLLTIWALFEIWRLLNRYDNWLAQTRSDDSNFRPVWLRHLIVIGVPLVIIWGLENILGRYFGLDYFERFWADFTVLFLLFIIAVEALFQIDRPFPKMIEDTEDIEAISTPDSVVQDWEGAGVELRDRVMRNTWHLDPELSLESLSRHVGTNRAYLSRTLNQGLGMSFSSFINGLRVAHAKDLLREDSMSVLDVALESGFGSKASFNRAFKRHAGMTPSQYLRASGT